MLGEHVERVARDHRLLDVAVAHPLRDHRALHQVAAELRENAPDRDRIQGVTGAADPLQAARDRLRRLDLDHQVDRAHVDPQLERGGGHQARELPRLQELLDDLPLLVGQRAVMRSRNLVNNSAGSLACGYVSGGFGRRRGGRPGRRDGLVVGQFVQALGDSFGCAAVVDEDEGRGVLAHQLEDLRVDRRPDRALVHRTIEVGVDLVRLLERSPRVGHVLHRDVDLQVELLADAGVDHLALPLRADEELRDPLERALRGREPDPLRVGVLIRADEVGEALERQDEVRAALGLGDGVDLVDDHRLDPGEDVARLRGHHQVERLGGGDEDVGRLSQHRLALALRGIAGAKAHGDLHVPDTTERSAEVALDVVGEGLQGGDVDQADAGAEALGVARELVDPPEEGREGLARARGRADQRVGARGDRRPAHRLGRRGRLERRLEPAPNGRREERQG